MRMKNILLTGIALLLVLAIAGCDFGTGSVSSAGADQFAEEVDSEASANPENTPFNVTDAQATNLGSLAFADDQVITLNFQNGLVDSDTVSDIRIYPLEDPTESYQAWDRGTPLSYESEILIDGSGSDVNLVFSLESAASNRYEVLVPETVTANGGNLVMNQDGDSVPGEVEDAWVSFFDVTIGTPPTSGYTAVTAGTDRNSQANFSETIQYYDGTNLVSAEWTDISLATIPSTLYVKFAPPTAPPAGDDAFDNVVVPNSTVMELQQLVDGTWQTVGASFNPVSTVEGNAVDATYSISPGSALENTGLYRWVIENTWRSAENWNGFPLSRQSTQQLASGYNEDSVTNIGFAVTDSDASGVNTFTTVDIDYIAAAFDDDTGIGWIDLNLDSGGDVGASGIQASSVTTDLFRVVNTGDGREITVTSVTPKNGPNSTQYRLNLEADFESDGEGFNVYVAPGAIDLGALDDGTTAAADDNALIITIGPGFTGGGDADVNEVVVEQYIWRGSDNF